MNRIPKQNYTQIPNVILDYWINILTPMEFKVLMYICRRTFGWHKHREEIRSKDVCSVIGISYGVFKKSIGVLIEHGLINRIRNENKEHGNLPSTYEIIFTEGSEEPPLGSCGDQPLAPVVTKGGVYGDQGSLEKIEKDTLYIKEKEHKENIAQTKKSTQSVEPFRARNEITFCLQSLSFEGIEQKDLEAWKVAYPGIDLNREIIRAQEWLKSNPSKSRKKNWRKFLTGWLSRQSDQAFNQKAYGFSNSKDRTQRDMHGNPLNPEYKELF